MIYTELTMRFKDGKLIAPLQNEIENFALETIGTAEGIYFDRLAIDDKRYFKFDPDIKAWVLHG